MMVVWCLVAAALFLVLPVGNVHSIINRKNARFLSGLLIIIPNVSEHPPY